MDITVYGPLRSATGEKTVSLAFEGETVADAIEAFVDVYPRARSQLYDGDELRPSVRVALEGERVDLETPCPENAELALFPAVQGGL
ncbi:ubiquitin-like small modifier protein 1 [Natrialbaceae archaeon AArc-T1-2]|uniref:ubiquitin-like small modifier protein 1 n=1 Tax=Natrialbaceae archaeon AArc-T1-2 TaxID=3053904 RepID=UPI00255AD299|nr:ubiquitin-like small modifier protein 1 [Natrialbaceae archaeon AArc-T1-2]WIV66833.1 MoaD/ThiS family protein [Natrialbaceae archaeon AArc-T1-2]